MTTPRCTNGKRHSFGPTGRCMNCGMPEREYRKAYRSRPKARMVKCDHCDLGNDSGRPCRVCGGTGMIERKVK